MVRRTAGLLLAAALTAGLFVAGIAGADTNQGTAGGLTYVFDDAPLPAAPSTASAAAACPDGEHVVGGGAVTLIPISQSDIASIFPLDKGDSDSVPDDAWAARASNNIGGPRVLRAEAVCHSQTPHYVSKTVNLPAGQAAAANATCGERRHVTGGGVRVSGSIIEAHINATFPVDGSDANDAPDDGWRARVANTSGGAKHITVFAVCARMDLTYRSHSFNAPPHAATTDVAGCPETAHVTGGGVKATGSAGGGQVEGDFPIDDEDTDTVPDDEWLGAYGNNAGPDRTARVFAICKQT